MVGHDLGGDNVGSFSCGRTVVRQTIATGSASDSVRIFLLWAEASNNAIVGNAFVVGNFVLVDELEGVIACFFGDVRWKTLSEATEFISVGFVPLWTVGTVAKISILREFTRLRMDCLETEMRDAAGVVGEM